MPTNKNAEVLGKSTPARTSSPSPGSETIRKKLPTKPDDTAAGFCVYLGPTIMGVIQSATIYPGTKPDVLKTIKYAVEKHPLIASLVVEGTTLADDRIKVKTPGNLLYVNYKKLLSGKKE